MAKMPTQKPGKSEQIVCTPPELLEAIKARLHIHSFAMDLAASNENSVSHQCYTEAEDAIIQDWVFNGWNWCNPPFSDIEPWVAKAAKESLKGAQTIMLVPASVGSNWWKEYVETYSYQSFLSPRVTFVGHIHPYPKDLALLFYTPWGFIGHECWRWKP